MRTFTATAVFNAILTLLIIAAPTADERRHALALNWLVTIESTSTWPTYIMNFCLKSFCLLIFEYIVVIDVCRMAEFGEDILNYGIYTVCPVDTDHSRVTMEMQDRKNEGHEKKEQRPQNMDRKCKTNSHYRWEMHDGKWTKIHDVKLKFAGQNLRQQTKVALIIFH